MDTHTPPRHLPNCLQIMFCSVDGWQTTTLGLGHLWHILFTHFKLSIYLKVNKMSRNGKKRNSPNVKRKTHFFLNGKSLALHTVLWLQALIRSWRGVYVCKCRCTRTPVNLRISGIPHSGEHS